MEYLLTLLNFMQFILTFNNTIFPTRHFATLLGIYDFLKSSVYYIKRLNFKIIFDKILGNI